MAIKKGAILLSAYPSAVFPPEWLPSDFHEIVRAGKGYKVITSFDSYWQPATVAQFEFVGTVEEFDAWLLADPFLINQRHEMIGKTVVRDLIVVLRQQNLTQAQEGDLLQRIMPTLFALNDGFIQGARWMAGNLTVAGELTAGRKNYLIGEIDKAILLL